MYDLPRKFTYGVIESYEQGRMNNEEEASLESGNQHVAEWHSFSDLNNPERSDAYVTRVLDPEQADLFYVQFFSSLSLVANVVRDGPDDPNALHKIVDRVKTAVLLVSDFGRLGRNQGSTVKDVILPYSHRINPYKGDIGVEKRKSLMFFMGN
ncbi:Exostosin-like protein [Cynara cardunculus var. scolymus]|uniref:Exostosin-like protein n=1 Tax=Cynara cardunculus var. scolymus TaxID=59895 RepID=A0A124SBX5_CYNCS|nr:Exostosin-like protein [Cynara cardunculus var. scolymus]